MNNTDQLSPRLACIASHVLAGETLADIGCDHGYLPAALIAAGRIPSAIAADLRPGPLGKAKAWVESRGLTDQIDLRLGSGLEVLAPGEAATIAIAGMGGYLIRDILAQGAAVAKSAQRLILQPMNNAQVLRHYLAAQGYRIVAEDLASEEDRIYEVIVCAPGAMAFTDPLEEIIGYGPVRRRDDIFKRFIDRKYNKEVEILAGLRDKKTPAAQARKLQGEAFLRALEEVKNEKS